MRAGPTTTKEAGAASFIRRDLAAGADNLPAWVYAETALGTGAWVGYAGDVIPTFEMKPPIRPLSLTGAITAARCLVAQPATAPDAASPDARLAPAW